MKTVLALLLLAAPNVTYGQARPATCEVRPLWAIKGGVRSADLGAIGKFEPSGKEGVTIRSFRLFDSGLVVSAGIDYMFDSSRKPEPIPFRIALAIAVSGQEKKKIFESEESSEASTQYSKNWNLQVTKNIHIEDRTYMVTLSCRDDSKHVAKVAALYEEPDRRHPTIP